ncbi:MAG: AMP-dependent synthetase/ligase [Bacteroidia bacterium]
MQFNRLFDVFYYQQQHNPLPDALADKVKGEWIKYSTQDVLDNINAVSRGLYNLGIRPGDKIAIVSTNRTEWNFIDLGLLQIGAINVPVYPNISIEDYRFIFADAEVKLVFVSDKPLYNKLRPLLDEIPSLQNIYTFNEVEGAPNWKEMLKDETVVSQDIIQAVMREIKPDALATIIYTSGTTGTPKGVMLSHNNIISNIKATLKVIPIQTYDRTVSALPICHVFERMATYLFMYKGARIYYAERVESIGENLREVKPHFFTTVPRILEKAYEKIMAKGHELTGIKKELFFWAHGLAEQYDTAKPGSAFYRMQLALARKLVFKKWKDALGGEVTGIFCGAAALQPRLARIFNGAGITVCEGYGQTESSPVIAVNHMEPEDMRFGTVGLPLDGVQVKIAHDGEILVKGPNVMLGYYKRPDLTAQTIDPNGWLHTGDVGTWVEDRFLKITDRKKELFKTSGGKYVAPQVIENQFKESDFIEQIMIIGENQKTISALIVPSFPTLENWVSEQGLKFSSKEEMVKSPEVHKKYASIRDGFNKKFSDVEKVKRFALLPDEWSVDTGELTPTLKLKRKIIMEKYKHIVHEIYHDEKE